jgi:beta-propeller repeat-containing protein
MLFEEKIESPLPPRTSSNRWRARVLAAAVAGALSPLVASAQSAPAPAIGMYTVTPCRVIDTRNANGPYGGPALAANSDRTFGITGRCNIPSTADSVAVNITVTGATASGDVRIYPAGAPLSLASAINYSAGKTRANNGNYNLGSGGGLSFHCDQASGTVHMILDVTGYFETEATPPPTPTPTPPPGGSIWSRRFGGSSDDRSQAVAADGSGNVAVTGHFNGTTDFGGGNVSSYVHPSLGSTADIFVASYSPSGAYRWARTIGGGSSEEGKGICTDSSNNVLATGYQSSTSADFGGGPQYVSALTDIFIAKYSSAGAWVWSKTVGGYGADQGNAIAADTAGNALVTGYIGQATMGDIGVNFGGGALFSAGNYDAFLVKYSPTGQHIWSKRFGSTGYDIGMAVAADAAGNVFVAGTFEGSVDFGGGALTSAGLKDIFVLKYSATGQHSWSKRFGSSGDDVVNALAVDSAGDIVVSGKFQGSVSFGGTALTSAGGDDAFLIKLSGASGGHVWSKRFGSTSQDIATGVAIDGSNNVAVSGYYAGAVDFGGGPLTSFGTDVFVAKYNSGGAHLWSRRFGGADAQISDGVAAAPNGAVSVAGFFNQAIDFGAGPMTSAGAYDACVAGLGP